MIASKRMKSAWCLSRNSKLPKVWFLFSLKAFLWCLPQYWFAGDELLQLPDGSLYLALSWRRFASNLDFLIDRSSLGATNQKSVTLLLCSIRRPFSSSQCQGFSSLFWVQRDNADVSGVVHHIFILCWVLWVLPLSWSGKFSQHHPLPSPLLKLSFPTWLAILRHLSSPWNLFFPQSYFPQFFRVDQFLQFCLLISLEDEFLISDILLFQPRIFISFTYSFLMRCCMCSLIGNMLPSHDAELLNSSPSGASEAA